MPRPHGDISVPKGREGWYWRIEAKPWIYQELYRILMRELGWTYDYAVQRSNVNYDLFFISDGGDRYFKMIGLPHGIMLQLMETNDFYNGGMARERGEREGREEPERVR